jgi:hypothetical protein
MAGLSAWVDGNFNVIQTVGIIGSLWMGILAAHREAKAKETENLLTIAEQHRELWVEAHQRKELGRIFLENADMTEAVSIAETVFLRLVISHFQSIWLVANAGGLLTLKELALDAGEFFSLPLPRAVWEKTKATRNPKFVRFIERAMK